MKRWTVDLHQAATGEFGNGHHVVDADSTALKDKCVVFYRDLPDGCYEIAGVFPIHAVRSIRLLGKAT